MLSSIKSKVNQKVVFLLLLTSIFLSFIPFTQAHATTLSGTRLNTGANFTAWYDASVINLGYQGDMDKGRAYWNNSAANVYIDKNTGSYGGDQDKYFVGNTTINGLLGQTNYYLQSVGGTYQVSTGEDFNYCTVVLYDNSMKGHIKDGTFDAAHASYNAAHEIGHSIKMDHPNTVSSPSSVMWQGWNAIPAYITTYDENDAVAKWGNI